MASLKLFAFVICVLACTANAQVGILSTVVDATKNLLDSTIPKILLEEFNNVLTKEGYRFNYKTSDGSYREEVGIILNPGTDQEELVVMGAYSYADGDTVTTTMYKADKNGYKPMVQQKIRGVSPKCLSNLCG